MLVFTRRRGETIMIGDGIEVQVLRVGRDGVRLGVVAPPTVPVHRREIYDQICQANRNAAKPVSDLMALTRRLQSPSTLRQAQGRPEQGRGTTDAQGTVSDVEPRRS